MSSRAARWPAGAALAAAVALAAPRAHADTTCDGARAARLDAALADEAVAASRWRWSWAAIFGVAAAGQLALALADVSPDDDRHDARIAVLYLGAAKATIGLGARLVIPPRVTRPRLTGDACADDAAARRAIARTAVRERRSMALNVFGGLALNLGTSVYVGVHDRSWTDAGLSFGVGTVVATVSALTQPRFIWRRGHTDARGPLVTAWRLAPLAAPHATGLAVTGTF